MESKGSSSIPAPSTQSGPAASSSIRQRIAAFEQLASASSAPVPKTAAAAAAAAAAGAGVKPTPAKVASPPVNQSAAIQAADTVQSPSDHTDVIPSSAGSMTALPAPAAAGAVVPADDGAGAIASGDEVKLNPYDPVEPCVLLVSRL